MEGVCLRFLFSSVVYAEPLCTKYVYIYLYIPTEGEGEVRYWGENENENKNGKIN